MAEPFLEEIYQYSNTVSRLRYVVERIREHDDHHAVMELNDLIEEICSLCKKSVELQYKNVMLLWQGVQELNRIQEDLIYMGDIIENTILPLMEEWIQSLASVSLQVDDEFLIESTACGFLTVKNIRTNLYLHSNNNPMEEARKIIKVFYDPEKSQYSIFGCGMGYHVYALYLESNGSVPIKLYEVDYKIIEYAKRYGILEWVPEECLEIIVDDSVLPFLKSIDNEDTGMFFHMPSVKQIKNEIEREAMLGVCVQQNTWKRFEKDIQINFWRNVNADIKDISAIDKNSIKKDVVVVAAGPSLDDNMELLRLWKNKKTIIAVGTVFKKLISEGIKPDFVMIMDPQKRTIKQIEGIEEEQVPLVIDSTAYWGFAALYKGKKYMVCTSGGGKIVKEYVQKHQLVMWPSGGTVAFMALEFAIYFHAKNVYMIGIDLSYPSGISHAAGTMDCRIKNVKDLPVVDGVNGKKVYTDRVFITYKEQIEKRIKKEKDICFYNMSSKGVHIEGTMENLFLEDFYGTDGRNH